MLEDNKYVRFDWAAKRMLRDKANFAVLEGLITVLLNEEVHIVEILESEGNQENYYDKFNRVDIKAKNSLGEIIIVEIQLTRERFYLERILYGVSKAITEHISLGDKYDKVKKVYSISILYFDLGIGADYLYHGKTVFVGVHTGDTLKISDKEENVLKMKTPDKLFPDYFIIRVNEFNQVAKTPLEEWIEYLKSGKISDSTDAPGLKEAKQKLQYLKMTKEERTAYDKHIDDIMIQNDVLDTAKIEGLAEGRAIGLAEGRAEGRAIGLQEGRAEGLAEGRAEGRAEGNNEGKTEVAINLKRMGMTDDDISKVTGLPVELIATLV